MNVQTMAFVVGIVLGALIIVSACVVWMRSQTLAMPGVGMTGLGVLLVGASIWSSVDLELGAEGFKARVRRLEEQVDATVAANLVLAEAAQTAGEAAEVGRRHVEELTEVLASGRKLDTEQARRMQRELRMAPAFDAERLRESTRLLKAIPRRRGIEPAPR